MSFALSHSQANSWKVGTCTEALGHLADAYAEQAGLEDEDYENDYYDEGFGDNEE